MIAGIAAAFAVDDADVAALVALKAEGVKVRHHLALVDVLVQTAVRVGAGVLGILLGQGGKALFGLLAALILGLDLVDALQRGHAGLGRIGAVFARLGLDQDVAHRDGGIVVVFAGEEHDHVVAGAAGVLHHGRVARFAGGVAQEVGHVAQAAAGNGAAHGGGIGVKLGLDGGIQPLGGIGDVAAVLISGLNGLGGHARLQQGLVCDDVLCLAAVGGSLAGNGLGRDVVVGIVKEVARAVERGVVILQLLIGVGEGIGIALQRLVGKQTVRRETTHGGGVHAGAELGGEVVVEAGKAAGLGTLLGQGKLVFDLFELALVQGNAAGLGVVLHGGDLLHGAQRALQEIVAPGLSFLQHRAGLLAQRGDALRRVKPEEAGVGAVGAQEVGVLVEVVIAQLHGGELLLADGGGGGVLVDKSGVQKQDHDQQHGHEDRSDRPAALARGGLLRGLLLGEHFFIGARFARGCAVFSFR